MKNFNFIYITIILVFSLINYSKEEGKLRWAFEIFRHGARTPYSGMNASFHDCFGHQWLGLKELTGVGLRQHFLVGYRNRIKYIKENNLINPIYDPREVYLISTDSNRTIMSANAQVQGLYTPGTGKKLTPEKSEKAIPPVEIGSYEDAKKALDENEYATLPNDITIMPVHSFFNDDHFIQLQDKKVCPKSINYYLKNQQRKEVVDFLNQMTEKYGEKLMEVMPDEKDKNILKDYTKAYYIFDTVISEYTEGVDRFDEVCQALNVTKEVLLDDAFKFFDLDLIGKGIDNDTELCLHSMSPIFDRLIKWMDAKIEKDIEGKEDYTEYDIPKFVMFSAHDSTCGAFMGYMRAVFGTEIRYPYFATNINLELTRKGDEKKKENYNIEYIINDESMLNISYIEFTEKVNSHKKSKEAIDQFCGFVEETKEESGSSNVYLIVDIVLSILSIVLIILLIITIRKKSVQDFDRKVDNEMLIPPKEE